MNPGRRYKDDVFEQFARVGKALASGRRLELLDILAQGPRTVELLAERANLSVANTSQHLQVLRSARLVEAEREGVHVRYRLAEGAEALYVSLRALAQSRIAEVEAMTRAFLIERDVLEPVSREELLRRALAGEATVLDVRPAEEFEAAHLPSARSIPLGELRARLGELPRDRPIVAYCRGPYCVMAVEAVRELGAAGFDAHRLDLGPPDWRRAGISLEVGRRGSCPGAP